MEQVRMVASGRPGGKPVRKRTAAAQQRFLEQLAQNEEARQQRLTGLRGACQHSEWVAVWG